MQKSTRILIGVSVVMIATGFGFGVGYAEYQPHMYNALSNLRAARAQLDVAKHDKGGHRVNAMGFIDQAITEVQAGISDANGD